MDRATLQMPHDPPAQGLDLMHLDEASTGDADRDPAALVGAAVDAGVTLLDTAELNGNEEVVGRRRQVRDLHWSACRARNGATMGAGGCR